MHKSEFENTLNKTEQGMVKAIKQMRPFHKGQTTVEILEDIAKIYVKNYHIATIPKGGWHSVFNINTDVLKDIALDRLVRSRLRALGCEVLIGIGDTIRINGEYI